MTTRKVTLVDGRDGWLMYTTTYNRGGWAGYGRSVVAVDDGSGVTPRYMTARCHGISEILADSGILYAGHMLTSELAEWQRTVARPLIQGEAA